MFFADLELLQQIHERQNKIRFIDDALEELFYNPDPLQFEQLTRRKQNLEEEIKQLQNEQREKIKQLQNEQQQEEIKQFINEQREKIKRFQNEQRKSQKTDTQYKSNVDAFQHHFQNLQARTPLTKGQIKTGIDRILKSDLFTNQDWKEIEKRAKKLNKK